MAWPLRSLLQRLRILRYSALASVLFCLAACSPGELLTAGDGQGLSAYVAVQPPPFPTVGTESSLDITVKNTGKPLQKLVVYLDSRDDWLKKNKVILFDHSGPCTFGTWPPPSTRQAIVCSGVAVGNSLSIVIPATPMVTGNFHFEADVVAITGTEIETEHALGKATWTEAVSS